MRLDTSESLVDRSLWEELGDFRPTGVNPRLVAKVRDALDAAGFDQVKIVVSGGRGLASGENFKMLEALADKLGLDRELPAELDLHLIVDNYATHKHPTVKEWLHKHPRFHVHFTPTSASWLNMVERFFRSISTDGLDRGVFRSVPELIAAIEEYIALHNQNPKPFVWTAKAKDILQKVIRANRQLGSKKNEALH